MADPLDGHKCRMVARVRTGNDRDIWLGELLEPLPGHEAETHCLHLRTPARDIVIGLNASDVWLGVVAQILNTRPVNPNWLNRMEASYRASASQEQDGGNG